MSGAADLISQPNSSLLEKEHQFAWDEKQIAWRWKRYLITG